ncbi:Synaptogyrin-2, partial [Nibea albiflora]
TLFLSLFQVFALVVFACITTEGYINPIDSADAKCIFNDNDAACHYAVGIGVIAFLACVGFLVLDVYLPFMSNAQERKYAVIADLGFSVSGVKLVTLEAFPWTAARATVAFSFFSIATWGILAYFALGRFRRGVNEVTIPTYTEPPPELHTPYPPTYAPTSYNPTTYTPTTYTAYPSNVPDMHQQPQGDAGYMPPSY